MCDPWANPYLHFPFICENIQWEQLHLQGLVQVVANLWLDPEVIDH
jgi:hypothetical protein